MSLFYSLVVRFSASSFGFTNTNNSMFDLKSRAEPFKATHGLHARNPGESKQRVLWDRRNGGHTQFEGLYCPHSQTPTEAGGKGHIVHPKKVWGWSHVSIPFEKHNVEPSVTFRKNVPLKGKEVTFTETLKVKEKGLLSGHFMVIFILQVQNVKNLLLSLQTAHLL